MLLEDTKTLGVGEIAKRMNAQINISARIVVDLVRGSLGAVGLGIKNNSNMDRDWETDLFLN